MERNPMRVVGGELVWCKMTGCPWWPALTFESFEDVQALDMDPPPYLQSLAKGEIIVIFLHSYNFQKGPGDDRSFVQRYSEKAAEDVLKGLRKGPSSARGLAEAIKLADAFATFGDGPWRRSWGCAAPSSELELEGSMSTAAFSVLPASGVAVATPRRKEAPAATSPPPAPSSAAAAVSYTSGWFADKWGVWSESTAQFPIGGPAGFNFEGFLAQSAQPPKRPPPPPLPKLPPPPKSAPRVQKASSTSSSKALASPPAGAAAAAAQAPAGKITAPLAVKAPVLPATTSVTSNAAVAAGPSRKKKATLVAPPPTPTSSSTNTCTAVATAAAPATVAGNHAGTASAKAEVTSGAPSESPAPGPKGGERGGEPSWYDPLQELALEQAKGMGALRATLLSTLKLLADGAPSSSDSVATVAAVARELRGCLSDLEQDSGSSMARARALVVLENHSGVPYLTDRTRERFVEYHRSRAHPNDQVGHGKPGEAGAAANDSSALVGDGGNRPVERTHKLLVRPPSPVTLEKLLQKGELRAGRGALLIEDKVGALVAADLTPDAQVVVPSAARAGEGVSSEAAKATPVDEVGTPSATPAPSHANGDGNVTAQDAAAAEPVRPVAATPVAAPVPLVDAVSTLRGRKLSERGNSSWAFVRVAASGFRLDCYQTGKLAAPQPKTVGTSASFLSSDSSNSSNSGDSSSSNCSNTSGGSSKRGGIGTVEGASNGCIAILSGTDTEFNRLLPQRRLKTAGGTIANDKNDVIHAATLLEKRPSPQALEKDTVGAATAAAEKAAAEKAARTKKKRKLSINETPSATVAATATATALIDLGGNGGGAKQGGSSLLTAAAPQNGRAGDVLGASSGAAGLPSTNSNNSSTGVNGSSSSSGSSTVMLPGAKKKRSKASTGGPHEEGGTGVEQDLQMNEAAKLLGEHWLRPPSPSLSDDVASSDAGITLATISANMEESVGEAAALVISSQLIPPPPPLSSSQSSSLPALSAEAEPVNVMAATQEVPPTATSSSSGEAALNAMATAATAGADHSNASVNQDEAAVEVLATSPETITNSVSSMPSSDVKSTENNQDAKSEEAVPVATPLPPPPPPSASSSLSLSLSSSLMTNPGDFSSPFLRACACCQGGYQAQRQHKLLGSWPVWDDGYFSSRSDDDHDDSNAKGSQAGSSSSGGGGGDYGGSSDSTTGVASSRPRRSREASSTSLGSRLFDLESLDPHVMIAPEPYEVPTPDLTQRLNASEEPPGSVQPFAVHVHPDVAFVCDFHAHLADSEIIGLLGGYWDRDNRTIFIQAPFPCRSTERADDGATDVEMDPASEIAIRDIIAGHGMQVVGWYHSHPKFQPDPSVTDIVNQKNYQALFEDPLADLSPFVGLIVGTYDTSMPDAASIFRYFHVRQKPTRPGWGSATSAAMRHGGGGTYPMQLKATVRSFRRGLSEPQRASRRASTLAQLQASHEAAVARREKAAAEALLAPPECSQLPLLQSGAPLRLDRCLRPCTACKRIRSRCEQPPKPEPSGDADADAAAAAASSASCARCLRLGLVCEVPPDQPLRRLSVAPSGTSGSGKRSSGASKPYTGGKRTRKRDLSGRPAGCKLIERFDPDNPDVVLDVYPSGSTCAVALGVSANDVSDVARGKKPHINGHCLRFQPWAPPPEQRPEVNHGDGHSNGASLQPESHPTAPEQEHERYFAKRAATGSDSNDYYSSGNGRARSSSNSDDPMAELLAAAEAAAAASTTSDPRTDGTRDVDITIAAAVVAPEVTAARPVAASEIAPVGTATLARAQDEAGTAAEASATQPAAAVEATSRANEITAASNAPTTATSPPETANVEVAAPATSATTESTSGSPLSPTTRVGSMVPPQAVNHQLEAIPAPVIEAAPVPEPAVVMDVAPDAPNAVAASNNISSASGSCSALEAILASAPTEPVPAENAMDLDHRDTEGTGNGALVKEEEVASSSSTTQESTEATAVDTANTIPESCTAPATTTVHVFDVHATTDAVTATDSRLIFSPSSSGSSSSVHLTTEVPGSRNSMEVDNNVTMTQTTAMVDERAAAAEQEHNSHAALSFGLALLGSVASAASSAPPTPVAEASSSSSFSSSAVAPAAPSWEFVSALPTLSFPALAPALDAAAPSFALTTSSSSSSSSSAFSTSSSSLSSTSASATSSLSAAATEGSVTGGGGRESTEPLNETILAQLMSLPHSDSTAAASRVASVHTAGLKCVCSSVVPLGKYYATYARRAEWQDTWRQEMSKGEKLQRSLSVWMPKMDLQDQSGFLADLLSLVFSFWRENAPAAKPPAPKSRSKSKGK